MHNLTGRLWSEARDILSAILSERGFGSEDGQAVRVVDITPERAPRTPQQSFGWGQERVVRIEESREESRDGVALVVTIAREMALL